MPTNPEQSSSNRSSSASPIRSRASSSSPSRTPADQHHLHRFAPSGAFPPFPIAAMSGMSGMPVGLAMSSRPPTHAGSNRNPNVHSGRNPNVHPRINLGPGGGGGAGGGVGGGSGAVGAGSSTANTGSLRSGSPGTAATSLGSTATTSSSNIGAKTGMGVKSGTGKGVGGTSGGGGASSHSVHSAYSSGSSASDHDQNYRTTRADRTDGRSDRMDKTEGSTSGVGERTERVERSERDPRSEKNSRNLPSRVAFVPGCPFSNLYGAVNCASTFGNGSIGGRDEEGPLKNSTTVSPKKKSAYSDQRDGKMASSPNKSKMGTRLKLGPPLLEIRRLRPVSRKGKTQYYYSSYDKSENDAATDAAGDDNEDEKKEDVVQSSKQSDLRNSSSCPSNQNSIFQHETLLVSRGIPGLGGNVSSTCLDFRPLSEEQDQLLHQMDQMGHQLQHLHNQHGIHSTNNSHEKDQYAEYFQQHINQYQQIREELEEAMPSTVRCATGLTSGALCIHTISNLFNYEEQTNESGGGGTGIEPSSTVAHYAPRQQRPATSVAWRPNQSGLVAIGLVMGSSMGSMGSMSGMGGGVSSPAGSSANLTGLGGIGSSSSGSMASRSGIVGPGVGITTSSAGRLASMAGMAGVGGIGVGGSSLVDRDFGCLVWDIEAQSSSSSGGGSGGNPAVNLKAPAYRFAHNSGVESLAWLSSSDSGPLGELLAVGCQKRNVQLYDLRVSGTNAPPTSVFAHSDAVAGVVPDGTSGSKSVFATFGRNVGEPVKIWDARHMDSTLGEIRVLPSSSHAWGSGGVSAVAWSKSRPGILSVAVGDSIRWYDTKVPGSRALPVGVSYMNLDDWGEGGTSGSSGGSPVGVQCLAYQPQLFCGGGRYSSVCLPDGTPSFSASAVDSAVEATEVITEKPVCDSPAKTSNRVINPFELYPLRTLVVSSQGQIDVIPICHAAPLAVSRRDGRIAHGLGGTVWVSGTASTTDGPSAMEGPIQYFTEDISARIMRRARCLHAFRYSTDARDNVRVLEEEKEKILAQKQQLLQIQRQQQHPQLPEFNIVLTNIDQILRSWRWIARVEYLSLDQRGGDDSATNPNSNSNAGYGSEELFSFWPAKGLLDAGVMKLLRMSSRGDPAMEDISNSTDNKSTSETLFCDVFDSPMRRAALSACGWIKKYGVFRDILEECEERGEFERAAALAVWNGKLGECVDILQRGANDVRSLTEGESIDNFNSNGVLGSHSCEAYAETLNLIAMCVAGFNMTTDSDGNAKTSSVWSSACESLLRRPDIAESNHFTQSEPKPPSSGVSYLRAVCTFLLNIGQENGYNKTIYNEGLSLSDRVAFACRFLPRSDLRSFLDGSLRNCLKTGNLEGLLIAGLDKRGIGLIQSYVDRHSDVQSAALISCRVVLPTEWASERKTQGEWLDSYRLLLNNLQMWHSRAAFDVGRCEHLRRLKGVNVASGGRRNVPSKKQYQIDNELSQSNFPPQLWARCNYCNSSLPLSKLRRQEGIANSWLSRQKPVLTCCPQCKKPLPRCSICLLSLGCLNPYMELQRERNQYPRMGSSGASSSMQGTAEDLSGLANIPFAEWFTWCMRCKHGGHAHHLVGWFSKHESCPVSGCDCRCQFDGIEKLRRPGLVAQQGG